MNCILKKEQILFSQNIKALSLFFIPNINDFRGESAFIKKNLKDFISKKQQEILKQDILQEYKAFLQKDFDDSGELRVHQGYFSGDSHSKGKTQEDKLADDIILILKDKERLLSFDTPLRFIFSVWALQEGWDNPNIFTLVKLANSSTDTSRHQQVGRGLSFVLIRMVKESRIIF
nr:hypothetical protein [Campylobacter sp. LR264d]